MRCECRRMLTGRGFAAALALALIGIAAGMDWTFPKELAAAGQFLERYQKALCARPVCFLLPVAATLPWSDSFLAEYRGGFLKLGLPRTGRRTYVENKMLSVAFSGFFVWILAGLITWFGTFVLFFPAEEQGRIPWTELGKTLGFLVRIGMLASVLASFGGVCAVLSGSGYLAFGFPLVGYYFCIILQERYFPDALWLYPPQWISGEARWGEQGEGLWIFLLLLLGVSAGAHAAALYGKLETL